MRKKMNRNRKDVDRVWMWNCQRSIEEEKAALLMAESRQRSRIKVDDINIFSTPTKLIRFFQDSDGMNSDYSEKQSWRFRSPCSINCNGENTSPYKNGLRQDVIPENRLQAQISSVEKNGKRNGFRLASGLFFILVVAFMWLMLMGVQDEINYYHVPT